MIGGFWRNARAGAAVAVLMAVSQSGAAADLSKREAWECSNGTCVQREESYMGQLRGSFEYGANVSSSRYPERIAELEAQQHRKYYFNIRRR